MEDRTIKVKEIVKVLNGLEKVRLIGNGYTNNCFFDDEKNLTDKYEVTFKEKRKYILIDFGHSSGFMIDKTDNQIYNTKGYGVVNKKKCYGSIFDISISELYKLRYDYRN